jgi:hypothetical protein
MFCFRNLYRHDYAIMFLSLQEQESIASRFRKALVIRRTDLGTFAVVLGLRSALVQTETRETLLVFRVQWRKFGAGRSVAAGAVAEPFKGYVRGPSSSGSGLVSV